MISKAAPHQSNDANFHPHLKRGSRIRVVAPSRSLSIISPSVRRTAEARLSELGLVVTFGDNAEEQGHQDTAPAACRIKDLNDAIADESIDGIISVIGGSYSIEVAQHIDYQRFKATPKVVCGYSDITVILNAIFAKTGVATYYGPHFSSFGMEVGLDYTLKGFVEQVFIGDLRSYAPSPVWSEDAWYLNQHDRRFFENTGPWVLQRGTASGTVVGGNLVAFHLLCGTAFLPPLARGVLVIEMDGGEGPMTDRDFVQRMTTILLQPGADELKAILIGRLKTNAEIDRERLASLVSRLPLPENIPVVANLDFGHTNPCYTIPIGGTATIAAEDELKLCFGSKENR